MALAGQNAWHICTGEALPRIVSGKYLPSQLRTQNAGPEPATRGAARARLLLIDAERIGEETGLRGGLARLLFLGAAEEQIEQAFGGDAAGRQRKRPCNRSGDDKHHAAPHALKKPTLYATLTPPDATKLSRSDTRFSSDSP